MKNILLKSFSIFNISFALLFFLPALPIIFLLAYMLGFGYLQALLGGDVLYHLSQIFWFAKFFPELPYWYPMQNGGVVPIWGYPFLSYFAIIFAQQFTSRGLIEIFQLLGFLSVPLTALGLYLFVWLRMKNQAVALIGAVFYVLAPLSWTWLFDWGFYTESVSYILLFPTLIFWDYFLESYLAKRIGVFSRISLFFSVLLLSVLFLAHPTTFFITLVIAASLTFFQVLDKYKNPFTVLNKSILLVFLYVVISLSLIAFLFLDFYSYSKNGVGTSSNLQQKSEFLRDYATPVGSLLGLEKIPPTEFKYGHRNIVVPFAVWIGAIPGFFLSLIFFRKLFALAFLASLPFLLFQWPIIAWLLAKYVPFSYQIIHHRAILLFLRVLIPIVGAFGLYKFFWLIFSGLTFWIKKGRVLAVKRISVSLISSILALSAASFLIIYFANKPVSLWRNTDVRYGPGVFDVRNIFSTEKSQDACQLLQVSDPGRPKACDIGFIRQNLDLENFIAECNLKQKDLQDQVCKEVINGEIGEKDFNTFLGDCQQGDQSLCKYIKRVNPKQIAGQLKSIGNWPKPKLEKDLGENLTRFSPFINAHKQEKMLRVDVSPKLGGLVQTLNIESEISQINLYAVSLSLLGPYWGYEQQVFFSKSIGNTTNVNNLAKWFGTKYLFMDEMLDPVEKYNKDTENWKQVDKAGVWEFANAPKMYSWTVKKPVILVIGSEKNRAYEPLFRVSVNGGFPYEDGWLVTGKENVDDYSISELKKFDTLILFGYSYKSQKQAFKLLDRYVKEGGNLFINTGWQYIDRDWQMKKTPDFFPVEDLVWSTEYKDGRYQLEDKEIGGEIDTGKFSPLLWSDQAWGVSIPSIGKRNWARTVLNIEGKPLVAAGQYGEGRVVWSGLNMIGHISTYDYNNEEMRFYNNLLNWLNNKQDEDESTQSDKVLAYRSHPDKVEFEFKEGFENASTFYWRESQFKNWKAELVGADGRKEPVQIYRAGPGFMLMRLENINNGSRLALEFEGGMRTFLGRLITVITLAGLLLYVILGRRFMGIFTFNISKIKNRIFGLWNKPDEEE